MMKKTLCVFFVAFSFLSAQQAVGCPYCNIHNFLASSVKSSKNIFLGEVIRQVDDETASIRVLKVLRGDHKVGLKVNGKMYRSEKAVGERFIFSDPTSWPPTFEVLPQDFEDEVQFLIQDKPSVDNMEEAIKRVQGVSVETQRIGMEYIAERHAAAVQPLIAELNSLMPQVFSNKDIFFGEHRLGKLAEALLLKPTDDGREFVFSQIDAFPGRQSSVFGWDVWLVSFLVAIGASLVITLFLWLGTHLFLRRPFPHSVRSLLIFVISTSTILVCAAWYSYPVPGSPSSRGVFLRDVLSATTKHQDLSAAVREHMFDLCSTWRGTALADGVYAMVLAEITTPDELQTRLSNKVSADTLALGLYFAGKYESYWWQYEKAHAFWNKALSLARTIKLRNAISREISASEQFWSREEKVAN
jgi:hypothetical protein